MPSHSSRLLSVFALAVGGVLGSVAGLSGCSGNRDESIRTLHCADDDECPSGQSCRDEQCVEDAPVVISDLDASTALDASEPEDVLDAGQVDAVMSMPDGMVAVRAAGRTQGANATVEVSVEGGACEPGACTLARGATVTFRAPQVMGYRFVNWSGDPGCEGDGPELILRDVAANIECVANYAWRLSVRGEVTGGSAAVSAASSSFAASCAGDHCEVDQGQSVTLKAPEQPGYRFLGWTGAGCPTASDGSIEIKPTEHDVVCTATFVPGFVIRGRASGADAVVSVHSDALFANCSASACQVDAGSRVTLEAPDLPNFRFVGFGGAEACLSQAHVVTIESANADLECVASYVPRHQVSGTASGPTPPPAIQASSLDTFATCSGSSCTVDHAGSARLFAPSVSGYRLRAWTGTGCMPDVGAAQNLDNITQDVSCVAEYVLGVGVSGAAAGGANPTITASSTSPGAQCSGPSCGIDLGGSVTLTTTQQAGFLFGGWSGDPGCTSSELSITLSNVLDSRTCTATYARLRFRVGGVAAPSDGGSIQFQGSATASCDASGCSVDFGTNVKLTALPRASHDFVSWEGCANNSTQRAIDVTNVQANTSCTARFKLRSVPLHVNAVPPAGGSIVAPCNSMMSCTVNVDYNSSVALEALASSTYVFTDWRGCTTSAATSRTTTLPNVTLEQTCNATFGHSVRARVLPAGEGSVPNCFNADCIVAHSSSLSLGAPTTTRPNQYQFNGWSGCGGSTQADNSLQLSQIGANLNCTANFALRKFRVDVAVAPAGAGTLSLPCNSTSSCFADVTYGDTPSLSVTAMSNFVFRGWTGCSAANASAPSTTLAAVTGPQSCTANFKHSFVARIEPANIGSVACPANAPCYVDDGASFQVAAPTVTDPNYLFQGWDCGSVSSATAGFTIGSVATNLDCVAKYERPSYKFEVLVTPAGASTLSQPCSGAACSGSALRGSTPTLAVNPAPLNFAFDGWTGCDVDDANAATTKLKSVAGPQSCSANFSHRVTASVEPASLGPVPKCPTSAPCRVADGGSITLDLPTVSDPSYVFAGWDCTGNVNRAGSLTISPVTTHLNCTAKFDRPQYKLDVGVTPAGVAKLSQPCEGSSCSGSYVRGSQPTISADPAPGNFVFWRWTGKVCDVSDPNAATTTLKPMLSDQSCLAEYAHRVRVSTEPPEVGNVVQCPFGSPCYVADKGVITLPAPVNANYVFAGWANCQGMQEKDGTLTINPVTTNLDCVANYRRRTFTVTTQIQPVGTAAALGTASCSGQTPCSVPAGDPVTLTATPTNPNTIVFVGWSGCADSTASTIKITGVGSVTCVATFRAR